MAAKDQHLSDTDGKKSVTELGNPRKPQGEYGELMLSRMNQSHAALTRWGISFLDLTSEDKVLDIGCGGGAALRFMAETVTEGRLYGIDYAPTSVALSRRNNEDHIAEGKMQILEGNVSALPFEGGTFSKIITIESFYFWENPVEDLREVRRVLRKGGRFLIVAEIYGKENLPDSDLQNVQKYHLRNPSPQGYRDLLTQAGFEESQLRFHYADGENWICVEARL